MAEEETKKKITKKSESATEKATTKSTKKEVSEKADMTTKKSSGTKTSAKKIGAAKVAEKETVIVEKTKSTTKNSTGIKKTASAKKSTGKKTKNKKAPKQPEESYDIINIEGSTNLKLYSYVYDKIANPKGAVLIVHGMMEHAGRYDAFARFLNDNGYFVLVNDLRGHGHSAVDQKFGFGEKDIFQETVQDEIRILEKMKDAYNLPIYLFGHSYGSMVSQAIIQNTDIVEKCVLCGTANGSSAIMKLGGRFVKILSFFKNDSSKGGIVEAMCVKGYGKKFKNGNWLSRDEEVFKAYQADEFCGGSFPFGFYKSMLINMKKVNSGINKIGKKKIFLIAGKNDLVGSNGKQVIKLNKLYLSHNIDSRVKIYPDCRHELLNEINKDEVYGDILNFFNS